MASTQYAGVVIEGPLTTVYHYAIPPEFAGEIEPGMRLRVSFGNRTIWAFCVALSDTPPIDPSRIKPILGIGKGKTLVTPEVLDLTQWIASYYRCGWGAVLATAIPQPVRSGTNQKTILYATLTTTGTELDEAMAACTKRAPKQAAILAALRDSGQPMSTADLQSTSGSDAAILRALEKKGLVTITQAAPPRTTHTQPEQKKVLTLSEAQQNALVAIKTALDTQAYQGFLLHGATGSGKTEVYLRALIHCLEQDRTGIILVPEISLTPQTVERFRSRVGEVAVLHSNMAEGERADAWRRLRSGEIRVAIGARSAVFAPLPNVGLIVVDEEHEPSFKQDNAPRYNARDVAIVRAARCGAVAILGSATPSMESYANALSGKYALLDLPQRVTSAGACKARIVDMREEFSDQNKEVLVSRELIREVNTAIAREEQVILFLNRRGFNTWVHCLDCKHVLTCDQCDISLTYHKYDNTMRCHYCDFIQKQPKNCPACGSPRMRFAGHGTERAEEIVGEVFPEARIVRMDSDTMNRRDAHAETLAAFARGEYDILLGTQMIAKGLDFPTVTVVGVLSADNNINLPDFRASERTFQLVTQVVGRAGRGEREGVGIIQAFDPTHHALQCAVRQDYTAFAQRELADRKLHRYPPYGRLARIIVRGTDRQKTFDHIRTIALRIGEKSRPLSLLGPVACPIAKLQAHWRFHLLIKAESTGEITALLDHADETLRDRGQVHVAIDIDPISLM